MAEDIRCHTNTISADDTFLLEDGFETQLVNLAGETQVIDSSGETQVLYDVDCMRNLRSEFFNEYKSENAAFSDSEETNGTQELFDTQQVSANDSVKVDDDDEVGQDNTKNSHPRKQGDRVSGTPSDMYSKEEHHSGSHKGFTSVRAAAIRASGLAARAKRADSDSSPRQRSSEEAGSAPDGDVPKTIACQEHFLNGYYGDGKKLAHDKYRPGCATVRKLFIDDGVDEIVSPVAGVNRTGNNLNMLDLLSSDNCLAGLSYANSQEPGELSQADALEVVNRFLKHNAMECNEDVGSRNHDLEKPNLVNAAKGSRELAKSSILRSTVEDFGVFDLDETREDEGGGEFFLKKKELFFDNGHNMQRFLTEPRKGRRPDIKNIRSAGVCRVSGYSDSGLMMGQVKAKGKSSSSRKEGVHKNLTAIFDEQTNVAMASKLSDKDAREANLDKLSENDTCKGHKGDENDSRKDSLDIIGIGPDTQIAAEAMETLCFEVHLADGVSIDPNKSARDRKKPTARKDRISSRMVHLEQSLTQDFDGQPRQAKKMKRLNINPNKKSSLSSKKRSEIFSKQDGPELGGSKHMGSTHLNDGKVCQSFLPSEKDEQKKQGPRKKTIFHEIDLCHGMESKVQSSVKKQQFQEQLGVSEPVAHRTRKCTQLNVRKVSETSAGEMNDLMSSLVVRKKRTYAKGKKPEIITLEQLRKLRSVVKQSKAESVSTLSALNRDSLKRKRTQREKLSVGQEADGQHNVNFRRARNSASTCNRQPGEILLQNIVNGESSGNDAFHNNLIPGRTLDVLKQFAEKCDAETCKSAKDAETIDKLEASPNAKGGTSLTSTSPPSSGTPKKSPSPVCIGDEYHKQSCRRNLNGFSLTKEMNNLVAGSPVQCRGIKEARKRREIASIRVLFSQHLDVDVMKQQKKILARLGASVASSMSDATHFIADEFVRTRNMLEAIAFGKPVVTHLWIESCGQASCFIDEKSYILRDAKKEKEFGFAMPVSLSRACQHPLLQGQKVLITPNTKPGKDILVQLVGAVHGLAVERLCRSASKDKKLPEDLLILSCEEDYDVCVPFLEKGFAIYSSELLLNGIVKQKLEHERYLIFTDNVKRTRSTIWVKKKNAYIPVIKGT